MKHCPTCGYRAIIIGQPGRRRASCARRDDASCVIGPVRLTDEAAEQAWNELDGPARRRAREAPQRVVDAQGRGGTVVSQDARHIVVRWDHLSWTTYAHELGGEWPKFVEGSER